MVNFYQVGSAWLVGDNILPKGSCLAVVTADNTMVSIRLISNSHQVAYCPISTLQNENGVAYNLATFLTAFELFAGDNSTVLATVSTTLIRPADTANYAAGDAINSATVPVKQKEIITLTGSAPAKKKTTITLTGTAPAKQKETITLTGESGTAIITGAGGLTKTVTFATTGTTDLAQTALDFKTLYVTDYLAEGIVLTNSGVTIVMEASVAGTPFVVPVITPDVSDLNGTVAHTRANVVIGTCDIGGVVGSPYTATYHTSPTVTAADFVTANAAFFSSDLYIDLTSSGADLIFEAQTAGVPFDTLTCVTTYGNLAGGIVETTPNVLVGEANIGFMADFGISFGITFDTSLDDTATAFVTANAASLGGLVIIVTAVTDTLVFEADVEGVAFTPPTIVNTVGDLDGTVANDTLNTTLLPLTFANVAKTNGGGGFIMDARIETDCVEFAGKKVRVWLFNDIPDVVYGDNVALVTSFVDSPNRMATPYFDVTFDALLSNSDNVIGKAQPNIQYMCSATSRNMYALLQTLSDVATPTSAAMFEIYLNIAKS
jgi:hypothetical protein